MQLSNKEIASRLDKFIIENFRNYSDFASYMMIRPQTLTKYLKAETRPGPKFLKRLELKGIDVSIIMGEDYIPSFSPKVDSSPSGKEGSLEVRELLVELKRLNNNMEAQQLEMKKMTTHLYNIEVLLSSNRSRELGNVVFLSEKQEQQPSPQVL